jgi:hypothetical protein
VWRIERRGVEHVKPAHFLVRNIVAGCAMLFDAELARRYPIIPDGAVYHDHWYALVASFYGGVHSIREALYAYRQHSRNELGFTPFVSTFEVSENIRAMGVLAKCRDVWKKSYDLACSAEEMGLPMGFCLKTTFLRSWDLGFFISALGLGCLLGDPALARACLARGIGKLSLKSGMK